MSGSLIDELGSKQVWEKYYSYKASLIGGAGPSEEIREFIDSGAYTDVYETIASGGDLPLPSKAVISKMSSQKKRTVYTYPYDWNMTFKLMTYLMLRKYDHLYCSDLYSFRPARTAKDAVRRFVRLPGIDRMYSYKVDISNYFNSVPVDRLVPEVREVLADDVSLSSLLVSLLEEPCVNDRRQVIRESKGIMAGTPQASFYANLYLRDMDMYFHERGIPYARYSDDIIVFATSREEVEQHACKIRGILADKGLSVNPDKECFSSPEEGWTFLGFCYREGVVDIAPSSVRKIKQKMRRKTRALKRWYDRQNKEPRMAAVAFIRVFNRKLFDVRDDNDLTWSRWYFPVINTDKSLHEIDRYAVECLRYLMSGTRGKSRFNVRYEELKEMGLRSLVHEYYESEG